MLNLLATAVDLKALLVHKVLLALPELMDKTDHLVRKVLPVLLEQLALPGLKVPLVLPELMVPMEQQVHKALQAQEVVLTAGTQMVMAFKMPMKMQTTTVSGMPLTVVAHKE
jgi:hypothetical protein